MCTCGRAFSKILREDAEVFCMLSTYGVGLNPTLVGQRHRGTFALATAVQNGDALLAMQGRGHTGTSLAGATARIYFEATETFSTTANGSAISFWATANGTIVPSQKMRLDGTGNLLLGLTAPGTNLTKGLAISSGTAPTTSPADAVQMWSADRAATAGKASLHLRTEDGTSHVLGDRVGIGTLTPGYGLHVATDAGIPGGVWINSTSRAALKQHIRPVTQAQGGAVSPHAAPVGMGSTTRPDS